MAKITGDNGPYFKSFNLRIESAAELALLWAALDHSFSGNKQAVATLKKTSITIEQVTEVEYALWDLLDDKVTEYELKK